jgi:hypothetical protein
MGAHLGCPFQGKTRTLNNMGGEGGSGVVETTDLSSSSSCGNIPDNNIIFHLEDLTGYERILEDLTLPIASLKRAREEVGAILAREKAELERMEQRMESRASRMEGILNSLLTRTKRLKKAQKGR